MYKGTPLDGSPVLLRSYDSRKEPPPEIRCTVWQAGRATCATAIAFKPIQIGQSVFVDEGAGKYNPAPIVLDEAAVNEWPGREVGVFVSIGTGKRRTSGSSSSSSSSGGGGGGPQPLWWEGFVAGGVSDFAEARRRLLAKIEGCEYTHQFMLREHLARRGVLLSNYYRLNVEVGVGEFGMNEWDRLADISTATRQYLERDDVQWTVGDAGAKMAKIHFARARLAAREAREAAAAASSSSSAAAAATAARPATATSAASDFTDSEINYPLAVELPVDAEHIGGWHTPPQELASGRDGRPGDSGGGGGGNFYGDGDLNGDASWHQQQQQQQPQQQDYRRRRSSDYPYSPASLAGSDASSPRRSAEH